MKQMTYLMAFAILLAFSCQRDELRDEAVSSLKTLKVGVADELQTRVGFDENNSFYWHKGDRIGVLTSAGFKVMTLDQQYDGQGTGVFTGEFAEDIGDYVVYPYGDHFIDEGGQLVYVLPSSYTYASIEDGANSFNPPMVGRIGEGTASLAHIGSFFKRKMSRTWNDNFTINNAFILPCMIPGCTNCHQISFSTPSNNITVSIVKRQ